MLVPCQPPDLTRYLSVIQDRENGQRWTPAGWMRQFVQSHKEYKENSVVSERICYYFINEDQWNGGNGGRGS